MSKVHIGEEVEKLLENGKRYLDASFLDDDISATAFADYKEASVVLAEKMEACASDIRGFVWALIGYMGLKPDVTAEEVVQMFQIVRPEVEM
jgi:hypothetical protein